MSTLQFLEKSLPSGIMLTAAIFGLTHCGNAKKTSQRSYDPTSADSKADEARAGQEAQQIVAIIDATPQAGLAPLNVTFNASASTAVGSDSITDYQWNFGDGQTDTGVRVNHIYSIDGLYNASLKVTTTASETAEATVLIKVGKISKDLKISLPEMNSAEVKRYETFEMKFDIDTAASNYFFEYSKQPPKGVPAETGITVNGMITTPSGTTLTHPAFFMQEAKAVNPGTDTMYFVETNISHWEFRFSPKELGLYKISLVAQDKSGISVVDAGSFNVTESGQRGFIQVSKKDPRYFEYSNGDIYWPIGPASLQGSSNYKDYKSGGPNFSREWLGGLGAYSTNWARWKSSAELHGNEGIMTRLSSAEKFTGHDLSYEIFYPEGYRMLVTSWMDETFAGHVEAGKTYQYKFTYKTVNLAGPSSRCASCAFGLVVKASDSGDAIWGNPTMQKVEDTLRASPQIVKHLATNSNWNSISGTFTANENATNLYIFLDNVSAGQAYIDEFSLKEINSQGEIVGGEIVRNAQADMHTYVESRPAAYIDWQLEQAAANGVAIKYVLHDKNDWIQNHLNKDGQFVNADQADGYYQPENTKARWLLRQWYRYVIARYSHSAALHSYELNNEGPPNEEGNGTAAHWETAQAFANYMHLTDAHKHLANTSFWCCWRPQFWSNSELFPDIDHADIHEYSGKSFLEEFPGGAVVNTDVPAWIERMNNRILQDNVKKPIIVAETGLTVAGGWDPLPELQKDNPGIWFHDLLWSQLHAGSISIPNYWFSEHLRYINRTQIAASFAKFVSTFDVQTGGYQNIESNVTNSNANIRVFGQLNKTSNRAYFWVQNKAHGWAAPTPASQSAVLKIKGFAADKTLTLQRWDTYAGSISPSSVTSNNNGEVSISVSDLVSDTAYKIGY